MTFAAGGTAQASLARAFAVALLYVVAAATAPVVVFHRRDATA